MAEAAARIVPGAPPPTPISKSQKKKRKSVKPKGGDELNSPVVVQDTTASSPSEKAPGITVKEGLVAPALTAVPSGSADDVPQSAVDDDAGYKPSPVVDLVHKRLKAIHKKIGRISTYASTPSDKLDDGQRRALKTLPSLEAVQKELEEVKKAIEVHESEQVQELTLKRIEAERVEKERLRDAVTAAEAHHIARASDLLSYLRFTSLRSDGHPPAAALELDELENHAVFVTSDVLLGDDSDHRQAVLSGFMFGQGEHQGVPYTRLHEILQLYINPPRLPTPIPEEPAEIPQELEVSATIEPDDTAAGAPETISVANSFHFMQKSELEGSGLEESVEWVERADAVGTEDIPAQDDPTVTTNGNDAVDEAPVSGSGSLDWAEEGDSGLPSLVGLHAKFGTSGTATPAESSPPPASQSEEKSPVSPTVNGNGGVPQEDDDGFTQAGRGGRGRRGGDGAFRQGFRGDRGERGGYRGVPRGRGGADHGFRGGDRGFRGGDRGGFRGGFRGDRGRGGGDGDWRGDGRGRGRGRSGFHEAPRGAPPAS